MNISEKSIQVLELPKVLEMLAAHAVSDQGAQLCRELRPAEDAEDAEIRLSETEAAWKLSAKKGTPGFSGISDVTEVLARAERGGLLTLRELLAIAALLRCAENAVAWASDERNPENTCLDTYFNRLAPNRYFAEKIEHAVESEERLSDAASPELSDLRRLIRQQEQKVREVLQHMLTSQGKYLQEAIVTQRGGRYCVPVKSEHKGDVPGLVHDTSASGATLFIEPLAVVTANNKVAELEGKAKREEERIIAGLSAEAASFLGSITENFKALSELDAIFARANFAWATDGVRPVLSKDGKTAIRRARHPLLSKDRAVPIDIGVGGDYDTLVITGPNTGGKTVGLKTLGLFCLMGACGLFLPMGEGSEVGFYSAVYADIGDEQSIEQSLSTFSAHMQNIIGILSGDLDNTLVLFDELGAGTDPAEGAALAIAIIEDARHRGAKVAATTHYAELKMFALRTEGVMNAACEFDVETLRPTYHLITGVPGKSNAFAIAARLGLPAQIIEHAGTHVSSENKYFEEVVDGLIRERHDLARQREEAEARNLDMKKQNERLIQEAEAARRVRESLREKAEKESEEILREAKRRAETVLREIEELRREMEKNGLNEQLAEARARAKRGVRALEEGPERKKEPVQSDFPAGKPPKIGEEVELVRYGVTGTVTGINADGKIAVCAGIMKVSVDQSELRLATSRKSREKAAGIKVTAVIRSGEGPVRSELDIRGMTVEEGLAEVENYIDGAVRARLNQVTIIHGKGTFVLRDAVRKALKTNRFVKTYRNGVFGEGDNGVTVVEL